MAKKSRIMEEMKNVAETYKICESSETHTSQNISCMSVAELKLKLANLDVKTKLRNKDKRVDLLSRTQQQYHYFICFCTIPVNRFIENK